MQDKSKENARTPSLSNQEHSLDDHISPLPSARLPRAISPVSLIIRQVILEDEAKRTHDTNLKTKRREIIGTIAAEIEATPLRRLSMASIEKKYTPILATTFDTFTNAARSLSSSDPEKSALLIQHRLQIDNAFALSVFALFTKDPSSLNDSSLFHVQQVAALGGAKLAKFLDQIFLEPLDIQPKPETLKNFCAVVSPAVVLDAARILSRQYENERTTQRIELLNLFRVHAAFHPSEGDRFHHVAKVIYASSSNHACRQKIADLALQHGADFAPLYRAIAMNHRAWAERRNQALRHLNMTLDEFDPASLNAIAPFLRDPSPIIVRDAARMLLTTPVAGMRGEAIIKEDIMKALEARHPSVAFCSLFLLTNAEAYQTDPPHLGASAFRVIKAVLGERPLSRAEIDVIVPNIPLSFENTSPVGVKKTEYKHISDLLVEIQPTNRLLELIANQGLVSRNTDTILRAMSEASQDTFDRALRAHIKGAPSSVREEMYRAAELDYPREGTHAE